MRNRAFVSGDTRAAMSRVAAIDHSAKQQSPRGDPAFVSSLIKKATLTIFVIDPATLIEGGVFQFRDVVPCRAQPGGNRATTASVNRRAESH